MDDFFASGMAADFVIAVLVAEALWLRWRGQRWGRIIAALLPAILMMVALRAALTDMAWPAVSIPLVLAFPVHLYDMRLRGIADKDRRD